MKFGIDQIQNPAPKWFKKMMDALIIFVMPSMATFMLTIPEGWVSAEVKNFLGAGATFGVALLKALQFFVGDEKSAKDGNA